jgi:hypothetical protein
VLKFNKTHIKKHFVVFCPPVFNILVENQLSLMKNLSDAQVRRLRQRASDHSQKNTSRLVALLRLFKKYNKLSKSKKQRNVGEEEE